VVADHRVGLIRRWGYADRSGDDVAVLSPEEPLRLRFDLREPRALTVAASWTGRAELHETRVEVYVVNDRWYAPRKYLATWVVGRGGPSTTWQHVPKALTTEGVNTVELVVPLPPRETHPLGWRGVLDSLIPGILRDPGANQSGSLEIDFVQISSASPGDSWEEFYDLADAYAERDMWDEVKEVYALAQERGAYAASPEDLGIFFEAVDHLGDGALRAQLEADLEGLIPHRMDVALGDRVEFLGYQMDRLSSERVRIQLIFRALEAMSQDYTAWVHAVPADPSTLFGEARQAGRFTLDHALATSTWKPGGIHRDSYEVVLPPGDYDFSLGLWRWQDGSRLWRSDDPDAHAIDVGRVSLP
jgi:hypothetical protein